MHRVAVELDDPEMQKLEQAARAQGVEPKDVLKALIQGLDVSPSSEPRSDAPLSPEERKRRLAIAMKMCGIWKGKPDKPQDGVEYQREIRAEWQ